jgi:hypothetical protein
VPPLEGTGRAAVAGGHIVVIETVTDPASQQRAQAARAAALATATQAFQATAQAAPAGAVTGPPDTQSRRTATPVVWVVAAVLIGLSVAGAATAHPGTRR